MIVSELRSIGAELSRPRETVGKACARFEALAAEGSGEYDGWDAAAD